MLQQQSHINLENHNLCLNHPNLRQYFDEVDKEDTREVNRIN